MGYCGSNISELQLADTRLESRQGHWSPALRFFVLPLSPSKKILEWSQTCSVKQKWLEFIQFGTINNTQHQENQETIIAIYL